MGNILFEGHGIGISFREYPVFNNDMDIHIMINRGMCC
jgi:hypothetical protein